MSRKGSDRSCAGNHLRDAPEILCQSSRSKTTLDSSTSRVRGPRSCSPSKSVRFSTERCQSVPPPTSTILPQQHLHLQESGQPRLRTMGCTISPLVFLRLSHPAPDARQEATQHGSFQTARGCHKPCMTATSLRHLEEYSPKSKEPFVGVRASERLSKAVRSLKKSVGSADVATTHMQLPTFGPMIHAPACAAISGVDDIS